jgi:hypothetical protein
VPQETILRVLHEALAESRADVDGLIERLIRVYRGNESLERSEQVIALGFLVCARALRESSLMEEIAVREELHELHRLTSEILEAVRQTERALDLERETRAQRRKAPNLVEDLTPTEKRD